jgi:hypothetical protein
MPQRPASVTGQQDLLHVLNQSILTINQRIDSVIAATPPFQHIRNSNASLNFGSIPAGGSVDRPIHILGAKQSAVAHSNPQLDIGAGLTWSARVSDKDTVMVRVSNSSTSPITPNVVNWNTFVIL